MAVVQGPGGWPAGHGSLRHRHTFHELAFMVEGHCQWWLGMRQHDLAAGDWMLLPAGAWHREHVPGPAKARIAWVGFDFDEDTAVMDAIARRPFPAGPWESETRHLLEVIYRESQHTDLFGAGMRVTCALRSLFVLLMRSAAGEAGANATPRGAQSVRAAAHTLTQNLAAPLRIAALARYHGTSASRFAAAFREELGTSPREFVQQARLTEARRRLRETTESVKEIATACGYTDAAHFCHHFKRATGHSPRAWRLAAHP